MIQYVVQWSAHYFRLRAQGYYYRESDLDNISAIRRMSNNDLLESDRPRAVVAPECSPTASDGPDALVRNDTNSLNYSRCLVVRVLILATTFTSVAAYKLLAKLELDAFSREFNHVGLRMTQAFLENARLQFWQTYAVSLSMRGTNILNESVPFPSQLGH